MNTPTPITDAHKGLWTKLFNLAHDEIFDDFAQSDGPAHQLIADSEAEAVLKQTAYLKAMVQDGTNAMKKRDELRARAERAEASLHALRLVCGTTDADKFATWVDRANARAERAEAAETVALANWNGALERAIKAEADLVALAQCHDDNCRALVKIAEELATERARLDWLESPSGIDWQWEPERLTVSRASIDSAMKEGAK